MENRTNRKWKFVFLGQQTINGYRCLLFQQTYPSKYSIILLLVNLS